MRIIAAELRKTLTLRFFAVLLIAVTENFFLFRHNLANSYQFYDQKAYIAAQKAVMAMDSHERLPFLQEKCELLDACAQWEYEATPMISQDMLGYWEIYTGAGYLQYTDDLFAERFLFRDLLQEVQQVTEHDQTLRSIIGEAKRKTSVSIFAEPGTFSYRNQLATVDRFEKLLSIKPAYDISAGVLKFQTSAVTDLIALVAILLFCTQIAIGEQKSGTLPILKATRRGRLPLAAAKLAAASSISLLVTCVLWGTNLVCCAGSFGLGDLSRPVQSLTGFATSTLTLSVGEYLLFFFFLKWALYSAVSILCLIAGTLWQEAMPTWLTIGAFLGVGYILSQVISPISSWNILKFVNISSLIFSIQWLAEYRNLNFSGYPVEVLAAACVLIAVFLLLCTVLLCWLFCCGKVSAFRQPRIQAPRWLPFQGKTTALLSHELWKLLAECGAAFVLIFLLLINLQEPHSLSYDTGELHYKTYMERLAGPLTEEKQEYLEAEALRFETVHGQIAQLQREYAAGNISEEDLHSLLPPLERMLMAEQTLTGRVYPQLDRILEMSQSGREAHFVYDPGYAYLFGLDPQHSKAGAAALVVAGIILSFSDIIPVETSSGMLPVLNVSRRGRGVTARCKLSICISCTVLIFLIAQIADYRYVLNNFGFPGLAAPLCSMEVFHAWNDSVSILEGLMIFEGLRLMTAISVTAMVLLLGIWTQNQLITLSVSTGALLMPILLNLLDIHFLDKLSFLAPLTGTDLLTGRDPLLMCILYYGTVILLGAVSCVLVVRYAACGYRFRKPGRRDRRARKPT